MSLKEDKQAIIEEWDKIPQEDVEIGGRKVVIRGLTAYDLEVYRKWKNGSDELRACSAGAKLVQLSVYNKEGNRLFDDNEVNQINGKFGMKIDELVDTILRVNGFNMVGADAILKNLRKILGDSGLRELHESISVLLASSASATPSTSA
jgi:hypothetical protein